MRPPIIPLPVTMPELSGEVWQPIPLPDADVRYAAAWLAHDEADDWFARLLDEIDWERHRLRVYSRSRFEPRPWTPALLRLRERVEHACGARFNSVLANLYRDGADAMGWHSDDERELGSQPVIASVSLGAERRFRFRRRVPRGMRSPPPAVLTLAHGSLLCMAGETQHRYQHDLPRCAGLSGARINLTFRLIDTSAHRRP